MLVKVNFMIILAVSDLDSLEGHYEQFWNILQKAEEPEIFLMAGDMYAEDDPSKYEIILEYFENLGWNCPIIACFGNREFEQRYDEIIRIAGYRIDFLDDEPIVVEAEKKKVGIVGSKGCLDQPTWWQMKTIPNIRKIYRERTERIREMLLGLDTDTMILLTHYAPTYKTLKGEKRSAYSGLGCKALEKIIVDTKATFAVHGHAHLGTPLAFARSTPIFNVALPVNRGLTKIDTNNLPSPPKRGLGKFFK
jgi:Icc-related predicted phosphoesterase